MDTVGASRLLGRGHPCVQHTGSSGGNTAGGSAIREGERAPQGSWHRCSRTGELAGSALSARSGPKWASTGPPSESTSGPLRRSQNSSGLCRETRTCRLKRGIQGFRKGAAHSKETGTPPPQGVPSKVIKASQTHHGPSGPHCPWTKGRLSRARAPEVPPRSIAMTTPAGLEAGGLRRQDEPRDRHLPPRRHSQRNVGKSRREGLTSAARAARAGPGLGVWGEVLLLLRS